MAAAADFSVLVRDFRDHIAVAGTNGISAHTLFEDMHVSDKVGIYILKKMLKRKEGWMIQGATHNLTEEATESLLSVNKLKDITIVAPANVIWSILGIDSITLREKLPDVALVLLSIIAGTKERGCLITDASRIMNSPKIHSIVEKLVLYGIISKRMLISNNIKGIGSRVANRTNVLHLKRYAAQYDPSVDNCFFESDEEVKQSIVDFIITILKGRNVSDIATASLNKIMGIGRRKMHLIRSTMPTVKAPKIHFFEREISQNKFRKVWFVGLCDACDAVQPLFGAAVLRHMSAVEQIIVRLNVSQDGLSTRDFRTYLGMGKKRAVDTYQDILQTFKFPVKKVSEGKVISFKLLPINSTINLDNPNQHLTQLQADRLNLALETLAKCNGIMLVKTFHEAIRSGETFERHRSTFDRKSLSRLMDYMINRDMAIKVEYDSVEIIALKGDGELDARIQYVIESYKNGAIQDIDESEVFQSDDDGDADAADDVDNNNDDDHKSSVKKSQRRKPKSTKPTLIAGDSSHIPRRKKTRKVVVSSSSSSGSDSDSNGNVGDGAAVDVGSAGSSAFDNVAAAAIGGADDDNDNDDDDDENYNDDYNDEEEGGSKSKRKRVARSRNHYPRVKYDQNENLSEFDNALILESLILDTINRKLLPGEFRIHGTSMQIPFCSFKSNAMLLSNFLSLEPAVLTIPPRLAVKTDRRQLIVSRNYIISLMKRDVFFTIAGMATYIFSHLGHDVSPEFVDLMNAVLKGDKESYATMKRPSYYATRTRVLQFYCGEESNIEELTNKLNGQQLCEVLGELLKNNWIEEIDLTKKNYMLQNLTISREYLSTTFSGLFGAIYSKIINENTKIGGSCSGVCSYITSSENLDKKSKKLSGADAMSLIHSTVSGFGTSGGHLRVNLNDSSELIQFKTTTLVPSAISELAINEQDAEMQHGGNELINHNSIQISYPNYGHYQKSLNRLTCSLEVQNEVEVPVCETNTCTAWKIPMMQESPVSSELRQTLLKLLLHFKNETLSAMEIQDNLGNVSLNEIQLALNFWIANDRVIEVPCMINIDSPPSYVHASYSHLFVVCNNDEGFCPWMTLKGERNTAMFTLYRSKVLSTLTSYPGSNIQKINGALPMLLMFQTKVLLQILEEDGFIYTEIEKLNTFAGPFEMANTVAPTGKLIYFIKVT